MKTINTRVITNAKVNKIVKEKDRLKIYVTALAIKGKANKAVVECLADYFKTKKSNIKIIKGKKSKDKVIEIR